VRRHRRTQHQECEHIRADADGARLAPFVGAGVGNFPDVLNHPQGGWDVSQRTVQLVIGRLVTDEDLRLQFIERPRETLSELHEQGFDLTADEIDALLESDRQLWRLMARRLHPRLQRSSPRSF
jgi:hypothetical protein